MSKITDAITAMAEPIVEKHGCQLWGAEFVKEAGIRYLRVYIDHPDGVSIDHCEAVSRELDPVLDENEDLIPGSYTFEVSSAGAERWLRGRQDFPRFSGRLVEVKLYKSKNGKKSYLGSLSSWGDSGVEIDISGELHRFENPEVAGVRLRLGG